MKTQVFLGILKILAKQSMSPAEYEAFSARYNAARWNQLKKEFPDPWDWFSEKYDEIRASLSGSTPPEEVAAQLMPGQIESYPEVFEPFSRQLEGIRNELKAGATTDQDPLVPESPNPGPEVPEDVEPGCAGDFVEWLFEWLRFGE